LGALSRVCVEAKPMRGHPDYKEWQTAHIVVFVRAETRPEAIEAARHVLRHERWAILNVELCDRLVEERVREAGGPVWDAYCRAQRRGHSLTRIIHEQTG